MKDKKTESVVDFLYEHIYCRYMSPGECIVHDNGGEFDGNLMKTLAKDMNTSPINFIPPLNQVGEQKIFFHVFFFSK